MSKHGQVYRLDNPVEAAWLRKHVCSGGVVGCAAEGVWGLCCDPYNPEAVANIARLKGRAAGKGYVLVSGQRRDFAVLEAELKPAQQALIARHWPGTTLIFPDPRRLFPPWVAVAESTGQSLALRLTRHPQLAELSRLINTPLVSSSANPSGHKPALDIHQVMEYFGDKLALVDSQPEKQGKDSAIISLLTEKQLR